jgi:thiol-disulfide isomerase/thioredoxin
MRRWTILLILLGLATIPAYSSAQTDARTQVRTPSGRLSLEMPDIWVARPLPEEEEIEGLDSESIVLGTSHNVIDQYLNSEPFDGTVIFLSAYPYNVYEPGVLGDVIDMMVDVTVFDEEEIQAVHVGDYPGAEFYFSEADEFFVSEMLFDTGELSYRTITYSTRMDEYELVREVINTAEFNVMDSDTLLAPDQATRRITSEDGRLAFEIPSSWLFWIEGDTSLTFASSGNAYADLSYSFQPSRNDELVFLMQRLVYSGLRPGELTDGVPDLAVIADRVREENGGLRKNATLTPTDFDGLPMLNASWLIPGTDGSVLTHTRLLDAGDAVYLIQAQYNPAVQATVDAILTGMQYNAPAALPVPGEVGLEVGQLAPDFTLETLTGGDSSLADFRGEVVLVNMWATWCGPCHREAPAMQGFYEDYDGAFEILAVNVGETNLDANRFVRDYGLTFLVVMDFNFVVAELYELNAYPTTYVIGRDGVIIERIRGSFTEQGLRDLLAIYVGR